MSIRKLHLELMLILFLASFITMGQAIVSDKKVNAELYGKASIKEKIKFVNEIAPGSTNKEFNTELKKNKADWTVFFSYDVKGKQEAGVETDGNYIYTSKWESCMFYKYNMQGEFVDSFSIQGIEGGIRDLAFDGTYFYGGINTDVIYKMDFTAKSLIGTIQCPSGTTVRNISYDSKLAGLWVGGWASDIICVDEQGIVLETIKASIHKLTKIYGSAYDKWSKGGPYLWLLDQTETGNKAVFYKINLNSLELSEEIHDCNTDITASLLAGGAFCYINNGNIILGGVGQSEKIFAYNLGLYKVSACDISPASVISPLNSDSLTEASVIKVKVVNNDTVTHKDIPITYIIDGGAPVSEVINANIAGGSSIIYSFQTVADLSAPGKEYSIKIYTGYNCDTEKNNDTLISKVKNYYDVAPLSIDVSPLIMPGKVIPKATVKNNGTLAVSFNVTLEIENGYMSKKSIVKLEPNMTEQISFDEWDAVIGNYNLKVTTDLNIDSLPVNNQITKQVKVSEPVKVYCYVAYDPSGTLPEGPAYTYLQTPDTIVSIANNAGENFVIGGTWGGPNKWYGAVYDENTLITIDTNTGSRTVLGKTLVGLTGMAYDYTTGILYGMAYDGAQNSLLYKVNQKTGGTTLIGTTAATLLINLACDTLGRLYASSITNDSLYTIDKNSGKGSKIGYIGFDSGYAQDMEFDWNTNTCYMAAYNSALSQGELRVVDVETGSTSLLGIFANGAEITGLAIPVNYKPKSNDIIAISIDENPIMPAETISPKATIMNMGNTASFNAYLKISDGYESTKQITDLEAYDAMQITFDSWSPAIGDYTLKFYTDLQDDANRNNDTVTYQISVKVLTKVYGYVAYDASGILPVGPVFTYLEAPLLINSIADQSALNFLGAGTWGANNKWLGSVYSDKKLVSLDTIGGARTVLSSINTDMSGISFDYTTNTLFGVANVGSVSNLYRISQATGNAMLVGPVTSGYLINLACDKDGKLYSVNMSNDTLYSINKITGAGTVIGPIGFNASYAQDMEFDRKTNICYMAAFNADNSTGELRIVDLATGSTSLIGAFGGRQNVEITGFAIPYNGNIPEIDVGVVAQTSPVDGCGLSNEKVTIKIENFGKNAVSNIPVHFILNNNVPVDTVLAGTIQPGAFITFTFKNRADITVIGKHTFKAYTTLAGDANSYNDSIKFEINHLPISEIPYTMGFESTESMEGWHIFDVNQDDITWYVHPKDGYNSSQCVRFSCNPWEDSKDYLFTKCIEFEKGKTYMLSFWYKCYQSGWPENMSIWLFDAPVVTAFVSLISDMKNISNNTWEQANFKFKAPASGVYYIAFYLYSWQGLFMYLDDISITDAMSVEEQLSDKSVYIFPNPANSMLNITASDDNITKISIMNLFGQEIYNNNISAKYAEINISEFAEGVYIIRLETSKGILSRKLIISR